MAILKPPYPAARIRVSLDGAEPTMQTAVVNRSSTSPIVGCGIGGSQCAQLDAGGAGATISQTLSTTPGQIYQLIYFADNSTAGQPNALSVIWDGSPVTGLTLANAPNQTYQQYTATVVASTASTILSFSSSAAGNGWYLDNVSVKAATGLPLITAISPNTGSASGGTDGFAHRPEFLRRHFRHLCRCCRHRPCGHQRRHRHHNKFAGRACGPRGRDRSHSGR